ncbi:MAG: 16S rRNA (guanine(527)-N(7))-methyltransferase RsmG [Peptococcaceae bacterium]|nr:16S rRNA (guanine(527)-N(7))-methyltransferase RsmG [Peptococcaceae bacterium]
MAAFRIHYEIMAEENRKHSLTSIMGEKEVAVKHFIDSMTCLKVLDLEKEYVVDLGTGAGFPGVPLKIIRPRIKLLLVDSAKKKVEFLADLIKKIGLEKTEARWDRAERMGGSSEYREKAEIVVSRAVASLNALAELCLPLVKVGGMFLAMKGPGAEEEMKTARKAIDLLGGTVERVERFRLPLIPEERSLILIRKTAPTPERYPRRPGIPAKRPLV